MTEAIFTEVITDGEPQVSHPGPEPADPLSPTPDPPDPMQPDPARPEPIQPDPVPAPPPGPPGPDPVPPRPGGPDPVPPLPEPDPVPPRPPGPDPEPPLPGPGPDPVTAQDTPGTHPEADTALRQRVGDAETQRESESEPAGAANAAPWADGWKRP